MHWLRRRELAVYAFEPTPDTHKWLCRTASLSKGEIIPIQRALGDKCEEIELFLDNSGGGANKLYTQQKPTNKKPIEDSALPLVKVTTID